MTMDKKFDNRLHQRNLDDGTLAQKDLDKHLESLPDTAANAGTVTTPQPPPLVGLNAKSDEGDAK